MTIYGKGIFRNIGKIALNGKNDKFSAKNLISTEAVLENSGFVFSSTDLVIGIGIVQVQYC